MAKLATKKRPDTRKSLIEAAHALIWANSYAHVSVEDICRAAGVQKGSFYHFFPTKAELAVAALEDHWAQSGPKIEKIFGENASKPLKQLRALCQEILLKQQNSLQASGQVCGCPYATVGTEMSGQNERLQHLTQALGEKFVGHFERLLRNAAQMELIPSQGLKARAQAMHTYLLGAMMQARITNTLDPVGPSLEMALKRLSGLDQPKKS